MKAFNPFIPLNADNSSIPAAFFDIAIKSHQNDVKYTLLFSVQNPFSKGENIKVDSADYTSVTMRGTTASPDDIKYGDVTVAVGCPDGVCQKYWYRGRWLDNIRTFWHDFSHGDLIERDYDVPKTGDVCSVGGVVALGADEVANFHFVLSWNMPNNSVYWVDSEEENDKDYTFRNYYATMFENSVASCFYALESRFIVIGS